MDYFFGLLFNKLLRLDSMPLHLRAVHNMSALHKFDTVNAV